MKSGGERAFLFGGGHEEAQPCQHCHLSGQELAREASLTVGDLQQKTAKNLDKGRTCSPLEEDSQ